MSERFADGLASAGDLSGPNHALTDLYIHRCRLASGTMACFYALMPGSAPQDLFDAYHAGDSAADAFGEAASLADGSGETDPFFVTAEMKVQAAILRCILGNPFRPVVVEPAWLTPTVVQLAHAAYDERQMPSGELDPQRLLVLADALEEAGCADAEVLSHLRGPGVHVRGCWLIDLLTGRR